MLRATRLTRWMTTNERDRVTDTKTAFEPVKRFGRNENGRDFLVTDIHGCFHLLYQALESVEFNTQTDRLFVAGDMTDRGPYSAEVLNFLAYPWVFAIRGNHEQLLLDCYSSGKLDHDKLMFNVRKNGMAWWLETPQDIKEAILDVLATLPFAMEIETSRGTVGLVHAEVPESLNWPQFMTLLENGHPAAQLHALWSRDRSRCLDDPGVQGIDRVYTGHTPQFEGALQLNNWIILDTGAVYGVAGRDGGQLTLIDITVDEKTLSDRQPGPVAIYTQTTSRPF